MQNKSAVHKTPSNFPFEMCSHTLVLIVIGTHICKRVHHLMHCFSLRGCFSSFFHEILLNFNVSNHLCNYLKDSIIQMLCIGNFISFSKWAKALILYSYMKLLK